MLKHIPRWLPPIAAALILIPLAAVGSGWLRSLRDRAGGAPPATAEIAAAMPLALGAAATAAAEFDLPLWQRVETIDVEPGAGSLRSGPVALSRRWRWDKLRWRVAVPLRVCRTGEIPAGTIRMRLSRRGGGAEEFRCAIPTITVREPAASQPGAELRDAGEIRLTGFRRHWKRLTDAVKRHPWISAAVAAAIAAVVVAAVSLLRKRRLRHGAAAAVPPWERALSALAALRGELRERRVDAMRATERLTDLVRGYLEARFRIPATRRTTPEFLRDLDRDGTALDRETRRFLRDFMESADLVKFARLPAGEEAVENAIDRAGELVRNTAPRPESDAAPQGGER